MKRLSLLLMIGVLHTGVTVQAEPGQVDNGMKIIEASYYPSLLGVRCLSNVKERVISLCRRHSTNRYLPSEAEFTVSNEMLGIDPARGFNKMLRVKYECYSGRTPYIRHEVTREAKIQEGNIARLSCLNNPVVQDDPAVYTFANLTSERIQQLLALGVMVGATYMFSPVALAVAAHARHRSPAIAAHARHYHLKWSQ